MVRNSLSLCLESDVVGESGLSAKQKEVYRNVLLRDIDMVNGTGGGGNAGRTVILNIVMQLRKCCNHPYLFAGVEDRKLDPLGDHLVNNCGKVGFVKERSRFGYPATRLPGRRNTPPNLGET